jgi:hypothetical protein
MDLNNGVEMMPDICDKWLSSTARYLLGVSLAVLLLAGCRAPDMPFFRNLIDMEIIYTSEAPGYLRINRTSGPRLGTVLKMSQDGRVWADVFGTHSGRPITSTSVSHDGCWVLFVVIMGKHHDTTPYEPGNPGLAVAEIDGNLPTNYLVIPGALVSAWSPDDRYIAFYRSERHLEGSSGIFLYDVENASETLLYAHPVLKDDTGPGEFGGRVDVLTLRFAWPGQDTLLFSYGPFAPDKSIVAVSIADGTVTSFGTGWDPAVSPSNDQLAFVRDNRLFISDLDGANERLVFASPEVEYLRWPSWSPDGKQLVFEASLGDDSELFKIDANGEHFTQLTHNSYWDGRPEWRRIPEQCAAFSNGIK